MNENNQMEEPRKTRAIRDFMILFLGIGILVAVLMLLKYVMEMLQIM